MKLLLSCLMLLPALAYSQTSGLQDVHEVAKSSNNIVQSFSLSANSIANATASTSSGTLAGAFAVEIFNPSGNSMINVGFDVSLSTTSSSVWYGREVAAGTGVYYAVNPNTKPIRVRSQNTTSAQIITVTQFK